MRTWLSHENVETSRRPENQRFWVSLPAIERAVDRSVNPGLCKTELARESDSWTFKTMIALLARTAEQGSRTLTHAAIGTDGEDFKGEYLSDCAVDK